MSKTAIKRNSYNMLTFTCYYLFLAITGQFIAFSKDVPGQKISKDAAIVKSLPKLFESNMKRPREAGQDYIDTRQAQKSNKKLDSKSGNDNSEDPSNKKSTFSFNLTYPEVKSLHSLVLKEVSRK